MVDPNFMLIGAQKCGTSWLAKMLAQHPDIYIPEKKERHFFNNKENYAKGFDWYRAEFDGWHGQRRVGDCTPNYLWVQDAPESVQQSLRDRGKKPLEFVHYDFLNRNMPEVISHYYPDLKLIAILRNPVERAISAFMQVIRQRRISPRSRILDVGGQHGIIGMGFYYQQLLKWLEYFDRSELLILIYEEDVVQNTEETLRKVFEHLGVDPECDVQDQSAVVNPRSSNLVMYLNYYTPWLRCKRLNRIAVLRRYNFPPIRVTERDRTELYELYEPEFGNLENLLGRSLQAWRAPLPQRR